MNISFIDSRATSYELEKLEKENLEIIKVPKSEFLYDAICAHPDIQLHIENNKNIILAKNSTLDISNHNINIKKSKKLLEKKYPNNIFLNAINLKDFFIHNLKYTDDILLSSVKEKHFINIKQGYAKCSCAIVNDNALITSDSGIYKALEPYPIDVLLIPSGDIELSNLPYGFIGGTCGLISENKMAFFGNLKYHKYGLDIISFLKKYNVEYISLSDNKLIDRGSILTLQN
ncbi:MAG: DUF6873 family GME fold protein [Sarcina sp.]